MVVISTGTVDPLAEERDARERREAEDRHRHRLKLPRRPMWTSDMTPEQLDLQVRGRCGEGAGKVGAGLRGKSVGEEVPLGLLRR